MQVKTIKMAHPSYSLPPSHNIHYPFNPLQPTHAGPLALEDERRHAGLAVERRAQARQRDGYVVVLPDLDLVHVREAGQLAACRHGIGSNPAGKSYDVLSLLRL